MAFIHRLGLNHVFNLFTPVVKPLVNIAPNMRLANAVNTWDLRDAAKQRTHLMCFDYLDSGADDEIAINRSRSAYADYECHYRVLAGNSPETLDLRTKIFGRDVNMPFFMWCVWASLGARFPFDGSSSSSSSSVLLML